MTKRKEEQRLILVRPSEEDAEEIAAYRRELFENGSRFDGTGGLKSFEDPIAFLEECRRNENRETVRKGWVPSSQFLFIDASDHTLIGMIQVRHELNDALSKLGGHIGYSIRPKFRNQGYAKLMLGMALLYCREERNLPEVMISCHRDNTASEHTILGCGGKLRRIVTDPETGKEACIYTITLKEEDHG